MQGHAESGGAVIDDDHPGRPNDGPRPRDRVDPSIISTVRAQIVCGSANSWRVADATDPADQITVLDVELEMQGDEQSGYILPMSPAGCFTADSWHASKEDALDAAEELFGARAGSWRTRRRA